MFLKRKRVNERNEVKQKKVEVNEMKNEKQKKTNINNMKDDTVMDVVFILDRSGSMEGAEKDTIGGYNGYIHDFKDKNAKITTVLFDNNVEYLTKRENVKNVKKLTSKEYYVRGCTALLDAIGKTINYMDEEKCKKVIFIITTDGYENASREYSKEQIKELIKGHSNWEFIYVGADIDSYEEATSFGISEKNIANYQKSTTGFHKLFKSIEKASDMYMEDECLDVSWKKDLKEYD